MDTAFAYWLLPEEKSRAHFATIIGELSTRFDAPMFEPHLTLLVTPATARAPEEVLREIASPQIALSLDGISEGERFTKTLFVRFQKSAALQELADAIARASETTPQPIADPHVSLLYAHVDAPTRHALADTITLPFREVCFDALCVMRCNLPVETKEAVLMWESIAPAMPETRG